MDNEHHQARLADRLRLHSNNRRVIAFGGKCGVRWSTGRVDDVRTELHEWQACCDAPHVLKPTTVCAKRHGITRHRSLRMNSALLRFSHGIRPNRMLAPQPHPIFVVARVEETTCSHVCNANVSTGAARVERSYGTGMQYSFSLGRWQGLGHVEEERKTETG